MTRAAAYGGVHAARVVPGPTDDRGEFAIGRAVVSDEEAAVLRVVDADIQEILDALSEGREVSVSTILWAASAALAGPLLRKITDKLRALAPALKKQYGLSENAERLQRLERSLETLIKEKTLPRGKKATALRLLDELLGDPSTYSQIRKRQRALTKELGLSGEAASAFWREIGQNHHILPRLAMKLVTGKEGTYSTWPAILLATDDHGAVGNPLTTLLQRWARENEGKALTARTLRKLIKEGYGKEHKNLAQLAEDSVDVLLEKRLIRP